MRTSEKNIEEFGLISQIVYGSPKDNKKRGVTDTFMDDKNNAIKLNNTYSIIDYIDTSNNTQAFLLEEGYSNNDTFTSNGNYVIAFRGTGEVWDGVVDIKIGFKNINEQYSDASSFTQRALAKIAEDKQCSTDEAKSYLTLTGHSLGGILTQKVGTNSKTKRVFWWVWKKDIKHIERLDIY